MKKKPEITNVHVNVYSNHRASVGCDCMGARFHYWTSREDLTPESDTLYKNPPLELNREDKGWFNTRRLSASSNVALVEAMRSYAIEHGLLAGAEQALADKERQEEEAQQAAIAQKRIERAAVALYEALKGIQADAEQMVTDIAAEIQEYRPRTPELQQALDRWSAIGAAIAKAEGTDEKEEEPARA